MLRRLGFITVVCLGLGALPAGCVFFDLGEDLDKLDDVAHLFAGDVSSDLLEFHSIVVVALEDPDAHRIAGFRMMGAPGGFEIRATKKPYHFLAFADMNRDLRYQRNEAHGWASGAKAIVPAASGTLGVDITIREPGHAQPDVPERLVDEPLENHLNNYVRYNNGTVSSLDNPWFSRRQGSKGLWQPFAFVEDGGTGIHFLETYDKNRVPVLFVHGINGSPQDFRHLIRRLDTERYQAWVLSYPSGLRLSWLARGLFQLVEILHRRYRFDQLHIVAHSMGGLVTRGSLNLCEQAGSCDYLRSYTTLSTPWNGVRSAKSGVKWAPEVVPVWRDLDPDSEYVTTLFDSPLPGGLPHHLMFGFRQNSILATESSDGVISLSSQLRPLAQDQAVTQRGFDEDHTSILRSMDMIDRINSILAGEPGS